jgi:hypothetical protein
MPPVGAISDDIGDVDSDIDHFYENLSNALLLCAFAWSAMRRTGARQGEPSPRTEKE